jgi:hypothetical protein
VTPEPDHRANNELAFISLLAADAANADALLRQRYEALQKTGWSYQRYNQFFPGALVAALGPTDTEPNVEWLEQQIMASPFPTMWATHRALAAILLCERGHTRSDALAAAASALIERVKPDERVYAWIRRRLDGERRPISAR